MESFILVLASLILLVPSVLYLPIGMTMKGKMSILFMAIVVTFVGLYASTTIDYWIMLCLLLALIIMVTIVIRGRFADMIFSTVEDEEISTRAELGVTDEQNNTELSEHVIHSGRHPHLSTESFHQAVMTGEQTSIETPQEVDLKRVDIFSTEPEPYEEEFVHVLDFEEIEEDPIFESGPSHDVEKADELLDEDQVTFLNDRESLWESDEDILQLDNNMDNDEKLGDMSDIEKWIDEEENGSEEDLLTQTASLEEASNLLEEDNMNQDDSERLVEQEETFELEIFPDEYGDEEMPIHPLQQDEAVNSVDSPLNHSFKIEDDNDLEVLYLDEDDSANQTTEQETEMPELGPHINEEEKTVEPEMARAMENDFETVEYTDESNDNSYLQYQMFNSMLEQLYIAKDELTEDEYEKLIKSHLIESLPSSVYYTFSNLLIDQYIATERWTELSSILRVLAKKYEPYPVLHEQLEYLHQQYCE